MKTMCLAAVLLAPTLAVAECIIDTEDDRRFELLETAERAWLEYRDATCELITERDSEELRAEAVATCLDFYARQRELELRLMSRVLTFTNVRSILATE
jgi:uncharacterized protein YecT (DUF1311 family)